VATFATYVVDDAPLGDSDQPSRQRSARRIELVACPPGAHENVLGHLARGFVTERSATDTEDERAMGVVDGAQFCVTSREGQAERIGVVTQLRLGHAVMVSVRRWARRTACRERSR